MFSGRLLHIIAAKPPTDEAEDGNAGHGNNNYKAKKAETQKKQAQSSHNWNTLFLGSSAVAEVMSDKYNVSKQDVLLSSGETSAAVRLALGETQIVEDTRKFLQSEGVQVTEISSEKKTFVLLICLFDVMSSIGYLIFRGYCPTSRESLQLGSRLEGIH